MNRHICGQLKENTGSIDLPSNLKLCNIRLWRFMHFNTVLWSYITLDWIAGTFVSITFCRRFMDQLKTKVLHRWVAKAKWMFVCLWRNSLAVMCLCCENVTCLKTRISGFTWEYMSIIITYRDTLSFSFANKSPIKIATFGDGRFSWAEVSVKSTN